jgi:hypothetical protein
MKLRRLELSTNALASTFPSRVLCSEGEPETLEQNGTGKAPAAAHTLEADMEGRVVWIDGEHWVPFELVARATVATPITQTKLAAGGRKR